MRVNLDTKTIVYKSPVFNQFIQNTTAPSVAPIVNSNPPQDVFVDSTKQQKNTLWKSILVSSSVLAGFAMIAINSFRTKKVEISPVMKLFKEQIQEFPLDIPYREKIISKLGNPNLKPEDLRPIIGPQEYTNILQEFNDSAVHYTPGEELITLTKDGYNLSNKEKGLYRANMHMHTVFSDGKFDIQKLLDEASEYADFVAEKMQGTISKAKHAPFTIAITDHDTVKGCQKAVEIISQNPEKYKNLRVILGSELSVEHKMVTKELNRPISNHMLLHAINPFDDDLVNFLESKIELRKAYAKKIIAHANQLLKNSKINTDLKLDYEDAKDLYPALKHGVTQMCMSSKDYSQFRTIFSECFEKNKEIQEALVKKGIDPKTLSYVTPKEKYLNSITDEVGDDYWKKYQKALVKYTAKLLDISENEASSKIVVTAQMKKYFDEVHSMAGDYLPKTPLDSSYVKIEDAIDMMKKQEYGYMGIAHPAITNLAQYLKNPADSIEAMKEMITQFKALGGGKSKFIETYYHYFGKTWKNKETIDWLNTIREATEKSDMLKSGSLDTHGEKFYYSA